MNKNKVGGIYKDGKHYLYDSTPKGWEDYKAAYCGKCSCGNTLIFPIPGMIICHRCESIGYVPRYWEANFIHHHEEYFFSDEEIEEQL